MKFNIGITEVKVDGSRYGNGRYVQHPWWEGTGTAGCTRPQGGIRAGSGSGVGARRMEAAWRTSIREPARVE